MNFFKLFWSSKIDRETESLEKKHKILEHKGQKFFVVEIQEPNHSFKRYETKYNVFILKKTVFNQPKYKLVGNNLFHDFIAKNYDSYDFAIQATKWDIDHKLIFKTS